jgi:opacity protein-like surface antigen
MKKIILTAAAIFAFGFANAQESTDGGFSKGSMFLSGSVGFDSSKEGDFKENNVTFSPAFGYFVTENMALGGRLNVESGKQELGSAEAKTSAFGLEVFGRYYWTPASQFSLFGELAVGFGTDKDENAFGAETKTNTFGINAGVGVNYFISNDWALEAKWAGLGYNSEKEDVDGAEARNTFGLGADLSNISLGLIYKF